MKPIQANGIPAVNGPESKNGTHPHPVKPTPPQYDLSVLVTEDDTPVDSFVAEKNQRLLTEPLYASWKPPGKERPFLAAANVGYFYEYKEPPVVPDAMLGLDVVPAGPLNKKEGHSYFEWLMGKPPDVVIEIVSDKRGGEEDYKFKLYARRAVPYYVIFDPDECYGHGVLRIFKLRKKKYVTMDQGWFAELGVGLRLWDGPFEGATRTWLRWCDEGGNVVETGAEGKARERQRANLEHQRAEAERQRADGEAQRAEAERQRAEAERQRADTERQRAERVTARLRELGIDPDA